MIKLDRQIGNADNKKETNSEQTSSVSRVWSFVEHD